MLQSNNFILQLIMTTKSQTVSVEAVYDGFASVIDLDEISDLSPSLIAMRDALRDMPGQLVLMTTNDPQTTLYCTSSKKIKRLYPNKPLQVVINAAIICELDALYGFSTKFEWGIELANTLGMLEEKELLEEMLVEEYEQSV